MPIFRVKSVKTYTGQKKFTRAPPMAPVTNIIRYGGTGTLQSSSANLLDIFGEYRCEVSYNKCEMCSLQKTLNNRLHEAKRHGGGVRRVLSLECLL